MKTLGISIAMGVCAAVSLLPAGCGGSVGGGSGGTGGSGSSTGGAALEWYVTCGSPVCMTPDPDDPNVPNCVDQKEGTTCAKANDTCEVTGADACGKNLICTDADPKMDGNCPVSLASKKHDIAYLSDAERARLHGDLVTMPLATWRYNDEDPNAREHLGFIIDDQPQTSPAVRPSGDRVDLYGYTTMAVAAIQQQNKQIEALQREVQSLREELRAARAPARTRSEKAR